MDVLVGEVKLYLPALIAILIFTLTTSYACRLRKSCEKLRIFFVSQQFHSLLLAFSQLRWLECK